MGKVIAVIGAGGKTTTLLTLGNYLKERRVLLTTTTHIYPIVPPTSRELLQDPTEEQLLYSLSQPGIVCAGQRVSEKKLSGLSGDLLEKAAAIADWTICEADGARMHPMKLHRDGEPVIPENTDLCVIVAGLSAMGKTVLQAIHRYDRNPLWRENPGILVDTEEMLFCLEEATKKVPVSCRQIRILLNQLDGTADPEKGRAIEWILNEKGFPCRAGSLQKQGRELSRWLLEE